jgi:hypothetical protein
MFAMGCGPVALPVARRFAAPPPPTAPVSAVAANGWRATMIVPQNLALLPISSSDAGFDAAGSATTRSRTLYTTQRVYNAWSAPGAGTENTLTTADVALSDFLYSSSTVAGLDTSGCPASPKPVMKWRLPDGFIVGNSLRQRIAAWHRDGIACVKAWASDGTTTSPVVTVSAIATTGESGDRGFACEYEVTLDLTGLADNTAITVHAEGYPRLGVAGSVRSTADETEPQRFSPRNYIRNTSRAAAPYIVAVAAGGSDTTSAAVSQDQATAYANPCATPTYAFTRAVAVLGANAGINGVEIHLDAGSWQLASNPAVNANTAHVTIRPKAGVAKSACTWTFAAAAATHPRATKVRYKGLTMTRSVDGKLVNAAGGHCIVEDCDLNVNGNLSALVAGTGCVLEFTGGSTVSGLTGSNQSLLKGNSTQVLGLARGLKIFANGTAPTPIELYNAAACEFENVASDNTGARNQSGRIIEACRFTKMQSTGAALVTLDGGGTADGFAFVQNVLEYIGATSATAYAPSADDMAANTSHGVILHNTGAGFDIYGRWNMFYNETSGTLRTHTLMRVEGNIAPQINTKHDVFAGENDALADSASRTGGWSFLYGVGCRGNFTMFRNASGGGGRSGFGQLYAGAGSSIGTSNTAANDPLFTTPQHTTSGPNAGTGGGTYTLQAGSPARSLLTADAWTPARDLAGSARSGTVAAGAYV